MPIEWRSAYAGLPDDWEQEWEVPYSGTSPSKFQPTPQSGQLTIRLTTQGGSDTWWNGSTWVSSETTLTCTIVGKKSRYAFTPDPSLAGQTLRFEGWMNDAPAITHIVYVTYQDASAGIAFGP